MPFEPFQPIPQPAVIQPIITVADGLCEQCEDPAVTGGLCRLHYYLEAVNGCGKEYCNLWHRPGKWVPPLLALLTEAVTFVCLGLPLMIFLTGILPLIMYIIVFGAKPNPASQAKWNARMEQSEAEGAAMLAAGREFNETINDRLGRY